MEYNYVKPSRLLQDYSTLKKRAKELEHILDESRFLAKPAGTGWSPGECIIHLNKTGWLLVPKLNEAIEQARKSGITAEPPYKLRVFDRWFITGFLSPDTGFNIKAPNLYRPSGYKDCDKAWVIEEFVLLQDELIRLVRKSEGLNYRAVTVPSPISRLLRLSLGGWFSATIAHQQRHLAQAERAGGITARNTESSA